MILIISNAVYTKHDVHKTKTAMLRTRQTYFTFNLDYKI